LDSLRNTGQNTSNEISSSPGEGGTRIDKQNHANRTQGPKRENGPREIGRQHSKIQNHQETGNPISAENRASRKKKRRKKRKRKRKNNHNLRPNQTGGEKTNAIMFRNHGPRMKKRTSRGRVDERRERRKENALRNGRRSESALLVKTMTRWHEMHKKKVGRRKKAAGGKRGYFQGEKPD